MLTCTHALMNGVYTCNKVTVDTHDLPNVVKCSNVGLISDYLALLEPNDETPLLCSSLH